MHGLSKFLIKKNVALSPEELKSFESDIASSYEVGQIKGPIHLSDGHEEESADCNRNVGVIYAASDDYMKAEPYLKEAVKLYKKSGVDDERLSSSYHHYAQALLMISSFSLAREHVLVGELYQCWEWI